MADIEAIKAKYPAYAFLYDDDEMAYLLSVAVDQGMDDQTFQAHLMNTNWWKTHSQAQRNWYALLNTDPSQAQAQKETWKASVNQLATQYGLHLSAFNLDDWAQNFLSQGIQPNDPRVINSIVSLYNAEPAFRSGQPSNLDTITGQAKGLAAQYMVHLSDADYSSWASQIATGQQTLDNFTNTLKTLAKGRFSTLSDLIDQGTTPSQYFSSYKSTIAQQLEVSPDSIDLNNDPKWSAVLGTRQSDGTIAPMTLNEAIGLARSQPEWRRTQGANDQASQLGQQLLTTLGSIK